MNQKACQDRFAMIAGATLAITSLSTFAARPGTSSSDPCAVNGLDFPAFIYWKDGGNQTQDIYVADSTGSCSRLLIAGVTQAGGGSARLSYPVGGGGNVGRVLHHYYDGSGFSLVAVDFTVNGTMVAAGSRYFILQGLPDAFELAPDGETLYYAEHTCDQTGPAPACESTLHKMSIPGQLDQLTLTLTRSLWLFRSISLTGSEKALYAVQQNYPGSAERVVRIDLQALDATEALIASGSTGYRVAAAGTTVERFAYAEFLGAYGLDCFQINVGEWTGEDATINSLPRYGRYRLTWYGDSILTKTYRSPSRRGECQDTGMISEIDPETGQETPRVRGHDPEGR
jgi:hypothetical protein